MVIHAGTVSRDPDWFRTIVGGSWRNGTTRWLEGPMHAVLHGPREPDHEGASNWEMDDEIYYDMDMLPEARMLATAYTPKAAGARNAGQQRRADEMTGGGKRVGIYDIQPQMWTYEKTVEGGRAPYRAFVSIPGHLYENFNRPNYRAILLRGIAWAGKRSNVDELVKKDELGDALRYVDGGPTHPSKAAAKLEVHPEFNLTLVAAEPLIAKAMNIDWDERGRLWVSETPEYPNGLRVPNTAPWKDSGSLEPRRQKRDPEDTISILSDTNGDGVMDRKHVFADKLELVTGFVLHKSGVIAATSPDIWFLEDTNGDQVADKRTKLYTGLGTFDTHAVINNLRWGLDGWIYATHGYSVGNVTSPDGAKNFGRDGSGVVRFKPDGSAFEQFSSRTGNTWGLDITWDGQVFWTQPTSGTVFFHTVLPESVLAKGKVPDATSWKGMIAGQTTYPRISRSEQAYVQIDLVGQFTAAAGCAIYDGGAWPDAWRYSYFTGEPTLNIVHHQFVKPDGVSYTDGEGDGPRANRVHPQRRHVVPADRDARRTGRRALRRGLLQPGGHPQRHARAAARARERGGSAGSRSLLRPHLARAAQAGASTLRDAGAEPDGSARAAARDGDEPERARAPDGLAPRARESRIGSAAREDLEADGQHGARALREVARRIDAGRAQDRARCVRGRSRRLDALRAHRGGERSRGRLCLRRASRSARPELLADFVAAVAPAALPAAANRLLAAAAKGRTADRSAQGRRHARGCPDGNRIDRGRRADQAGAGDAARRSGHRRRSRCAIVARW